MQLGLAWASNQKLRLVVEAFMHRCRSFISNEYIPGMAPPGSAAQIVAESEPSPRDA